MLQADDVTLTRYTKELSKIISSLGIRLRYGSDFKELWSIPKHQPDRHPINPAFNPNYCNLHSGNAFWIMGLNSDGDIVHTQAIKLLDLKGSSLAQHFDEQVWDFRSYGYDFDRNRTEYFLSSEAMHIKGRVTYHGEVWMKPGRGGYRSGSLIVLLTRLFLMKAMLKWSPDYYIGLQAPMTTCRGLGIREGYMRTEQRTIVWYEKDSTEPIEDWMVWMTADDARFNLRVPPELFYSMFKKSTEPPLPIQQQKSA